MRARVRRVDVAAEVVRLGLARGDQRADRLGAGDAHHGRADPREEPAPRARRRDRVGDPRAVAHARTAPRRRSAAASTLLELGARVERALRPARCRRRPARPRTGCRARRPPPTRRRRSTSSKVRSVDARVRAERRRSAGSSTRHSPQPSEVNTASAIWPGRELELVGERAVRADLRAFVGDLERALRGDREPQHPDLAREREHDDRQRDEAEQRDREADRQPLLGRRRRRAGAAARARAPRPGAAARPPSVVPTRPLAPKHAHGAPAAAGERAPRPAPRVAAARTARPRARRRSLPGGDEHAEHQLDGDQRRPTRPSSPRATLRPYVASAARADGPPAAFNPAAATSTSPRHETDHNRDH